MRTNKIDVVIRAAAGATLLAALARGLSREPAPAPEPLRRPAPAAPADAAPPAETRAAPDTIARRSGATRARCAAAHRTVGDAETDRRERACPRFHARRDSQRQDRAWPWTCVTASIGAVLPDQPVTLHLAAVPRVAGTNSKISVKETGGVQIAAAPLNVLKVNCLERATASSSPSPVRRPHRATSRVRHPWIGRRFGLRLLFHPVRRRNQCSETGIGKTALTALQRGRVDYAP